jgi:hypothetical protein
MQVSVAEVTSYGATVLVAIVPSKFTNPEGGPGLIDMIQRQRPTVPIMLVSIEDNGMRAYAPFETHVLLALIQLENLRLESMDLGQPIPEVELPF